MAVTVDASILEQFSKGRIAIGKGETLQAADLRNMLEVVDDPRRALKLRNYRIAGGLFLQERDFPFLISFSRCLFDADVSFARSTLLALRFHRCVLEGRIDLEGVEIARDVTLEGTTAAKTAVLRKARIGGALEGRGLAVEGGGLRAGRAALELGGARIAGDLVFAPEEGAEPEEEAGGALDARMSRGRGAAARFGGPVAAEGAEIGGRTSFAKARFAHDRAFGHDAPSPALTLRGARLARGLDLTEITANAYLALAQAEIGGALTMDGADLAGLRDRAGRLIDAEGVAISGPARLSRIAALAGDVSFAEARIAGPFEAAELAFAQGSARRLELRRIEVEGDLVLRDVSLQGALDLRDARVGGALALSAVDLKASEADVLRGAGLRVGRDLRIEGGALAGRVDLTHVRIGGDLLCEEARLDAETGERAAPAALDLAKAEIGGDVGLARCVVTGPLRAERLAARDFVLDETRLAPGEGRGAENLLALERATLRGKLGLYAERDEHGAAGPVNLRGAACAELDDQEGFWRDSGENAFDGLRYEHLGPRAFTRVRARRRWLRRQAGRFRPQPYRQLAGVLRRMGHDADARGIGWASEARRFWSRESPLSTKPFQAMFGLVAGFGFGVGRAAAILTTILLCAWLLAYEGWRAGVYAPSDPEARSSIAWRACALERDQEPPARCWTALPGHAGGGLDYESFDAFYYAVDVVVPLLDLDKEDRWTPTGEAAGLSQAGLVRPALAALDIDDAALAQLDVARVARGLEPLFSILGWVLTAFIAVGLSRSVMRD